MKKITSTALFVCCTLFTFAQQGSALLMKISNSTGISGNMKLYVSEAGGRAEINMDIPAGMPGMDGVNITSISKNSEPGKSYIINDQTKSYTVVTTDNNKKSPEDKSKVTVTKIGEETVNGFKCIHAKIDVNGNVSDIWTSRSVITGSDSYKALLDASSKGMANYSNSSYQKALKDADCDGFPVKHVINSKNEGTSTVELMSIDKKVLDNKLFEIPADYHEGNIMETMMGNIDVEKLMKMTPAEREEWEKEIKKKYAK